LYDESKGCTKEFTTLQSVLKLLMLKARYGLSDVGFDSFLNIITDMLPKENKVPANTYYAKKLISPLAMDVEKIHACRNHCILYRAMIIKTWRAAQSVMQVGTRRIKTIERMSVLHPCLRARSERKPKRKLQNPRAKKRK
jgi:hypothetical protein